MVTSSYGRHAALDSKPIARISWLRDNVILVVFSIQTGLVYYVSLVGSVRSTTSTRQVLLPVTLSHEYALFSQLHKAGYNSGSSRFSEQFAHLFSVVTHSSQVSSVPRCKQPGYFRDCWCRAGILSTLGALHARKDDEARAVHCYTEAHRIYPVDLPVISWLGAFHVRNEMYEKAVPYFKLAALV